MAKIIFRLFLLLFVLPGFSQTPYLISDSFDDNRYNWWQGESNGGSQQIHDGKMYTDFPDKGWVIAIAPYVVFQNDFVLEASFKQTGGIDNYGIGLIWGYSRTPSDNNSFKVSSTGYYYISNTDAENGSGIVKKGIREWVQSPLIKPIGGLNILKVEQLAGALSFYINGQKVFSTPAFRWSGGEVGYSTSVKMSVEVDDFKFQQNGVQINLPANLTTGLVKENLGAGVNTSADDLMPRITADGRTLYFGREYYEGNAGGVTDGEDFYVSTFDGTAWTKAENMGSPINGTSTDNISAVSTDENTVLYVTSEKFMTRSRSASGWGEPQELGITYANEGKHFESCLAPDGKSVLFTLKNSNNIAYDKDVEERDIYVSVQDENGNWSPPMNLGPGLNSKGDEVSPFLAADGRTLYFSTDGRPGYGGSDIFMSKRIGDGWTKWSKPINLGPEINTSAFDAYYVLPASGEYAYMVSDLNGYGKADIVRVKLSKEIMPDPVVLVRGKTLNARTQEPISAKILIDNLGSSKEVGEAISDPKTGEYKIVLPFGANYGFHAAAPGYLSVNENLELATGKYDEIEKNLLLVPIEIGAGIQLNNVFFEQGRPILKPESFPELDRLVVIMKENPTMEIEVGGHTDNLGKPTSLLALSQDRAGTVRKYLIDHGIPGQRVAGRGYGPSNPVVKNDTEEHRRMNRRVEFKVMKK